MDLTCTRYIAMKEQDLLSTFKVNLFSAAHKKIHGDFGHFQEQNPIQSILIYTKTKEAFFLTFAYR